MNKKKLIEKIAVEKGVTKVRAEEIVDVVFNTIVDELKSGEDVKIPGFGNFIVKTRKARTAVIPTTQTKVVVPSYKTVGFRPSKNFKEQVK